MSAVAIVDSGGANVASIGFALERLGASATLTADPAIIVAARHVILPGVGAAKNAMTRLETSGLVPVLRSLQRPLLGICLGMQLLCDSSDEGDTPCLGIVPGRVRQLSNERVSVPHMGWNQVSRTGAPGPASALFDGIDEAAHFYFVHSFALAVTPHTSAYCNHAVDFAAAIGKDNFFGVQFHPERSSSAGQRLLANFLRMA